MSAEYGPICEESRIFGQCPYCGQPITVIFAEFDKITTCTCPNCRLDYAAWHSTLNPRIYKLEAFMIASNGKLNFVNPEAKDDYLRSYKAEKDHQLFIRPVEGSA